MPIDPTDLTGKTALITGGSKGIGKAIAMSYARAGARVAITARGSAALEETKGSIEALGYPCIAIPADLADDTQIKKLHEQVSQQLGDIDILVNNAGVGYGVALSEITRPQFDEVIQLNSWACLYLAQLCYPAMTQKQQGVIINMASTGGLKPDVYTGAYSASKAALIILTKQIASEWGHNGIRCVAICPGLVRTEMAAPLIAHREENGFNNLVNRAAEPEEIASMALFLASESAGFCQGSVYLMDGGSTVGTSWG